MGDDRNSFAGCVRSQLDNIVVDYPRTHEAHGVFDRLRTHALRQGTKPKRCVQMIGPSHAGKTTIMDTYVAIHNTPEALEQRKIPIFHVKPDANLTRKGMTENILETFEDYGFKAPPMSGSETTLLRRMRTNLKASRVQLLVIDDFHHVVHSDTKHVNYSVSETIKGLLIKGVCPIVMVGVEEAREPLLLNPQLALRAEPTIELSALDIDNSEDKRLIMKFMAAYLTKIETLGVIRNVKTAYEKNTLTMIFKATDGIIGRACNLIKDAITIAIKDGRDHLTVDDLALATDLIFIAMGLTGSKENPFRIA
jgi:hypothetical protein